MILFLLYSVSSPMLLIALAVFVGAFYIIHLKSMESKLTILGEYFTILFYYVLRETVHRLHGVCWMYRLPRVKCNRYKFSLSRSSLNRS